MKPLIVFLLLPLLLFPQQGIHVDPQSGGVRHRIQLGDNVTGTVAVDVAPGSPVVMGDMLSFTPVGLPTSGMVALYTYAPDDSLNPGDTWKSVSRNMLVQSEDITDSAYTATNVTQDSATTATFTAQNGVLYQDLTTLDSQNYTLSFKARAITGNTALKFYHNGSETGNTSNLTITATLTRYNVTVLGASGGGTVGFGIQDTNVSGHGQIEITEIQVEPGSSAGTYEATTTRQYLYDWAGGDDPATRGSGATVDTNDPSDYITATDKLIALGDFDGTDDYFSIPYDASLKPTNHTFAFLVRPENVSSHTQQLFSSSGCCPISIINTARMFIDIHDAGGWEGSWQTSAGVVVADTWQLWFLTYDGTTARGYLNGVESGSGASISRDEAITDTSDLRISSNTSDFDGQIALFGLWNRAWTASERQSACEDIRDNFATPRGITITCP
jgi:hypothetical protein